MAIGTALAGLGSSILPALGTGLAGAIAGGQKNQSSQGSSRVLGEASALEQQGGQVAGDQLSQLEGLVGQGPGAQDVTAGLGSQRDLASMLESYAGGGFLPNQENFDTARQFSQAAFAPEQVGLNQQFEDQQTQANRMAAQMGRPVNDPILQAKLAQQQGRAQERLGARQTAFESQFAQQIPLQQLGFQGQLAQVRSGLASQAMQNRQTLLGLGQSLQQQGQNFRLGASGSQQTTSSGGGLRGAITGGVAGVGAGLGITSGLQQLFGGGPKATPGTSTVSQGAGIPTRGTATASQLSSGQAAAPANDFLRANNAPGVQGFGQGTFGPFPDFNTLTQNAITGVGR